MNNDQKQLRIKQIDNRIGLFLNAKKVPPPSGGWIYSIRTAIGMSLKQLGKKVNLTPQGARDVERREKDGSITIQKLKEIAAALDMQLVYGLVPKEGSLDKMIEKRAFEMAQKIVLKTSHTMHLENQGINNEALKDAIDKRASKIKNELPKSLWN